MLHAFDGRVQVNFAILTDAEAELVAVVEELEQGLQLVIAIGAAAEDMQHQVELGWGGQDQFGVGGDGCAAHGDVVGGSS